ncbi:hypothetical protein QBZ16_001602 [Prototheca wickerhamii]|uniref:Major facilitator superfamily (MFS) profile domain-containing protein n=1 Tax=Prototheca wickerhamii TaxID=3111 RepID=A0AAD9ID91_PROWI|nr:hypothetical protein QBZ16_001602 [Prototheca wickerhamii]
MERGQGRSVGFRDLPPEDAEQGTEPLLPESAFAQDGDSPQPKIRGGVLRDKHGNLRSLTDQRARTTVVVNLASILERCNEQTLPALYRYVGKTFHASPQQLGYMTLACALVQAVCAPVGGLLGHFYNRVHVMSVGAFIWGTMCIVFAFTHTVRAGIAVWAWNGLGLGLLIPNAQSLIADYFSEYSRGRAFGALYLTGAMGGTLGALYATNIAHTRPLGLEGWQFAVISVGVVSLLIGVLNFFASVDPRFKAEDPEYQQEPDVLKHEGGSLHRAAQDILSVITVPSFAIVVAQGIVGSAPWNALVFTTLYMQLMGMTDFQASLIAALFLTGTAIGGQLGGWLGDVAARRSPRHGRILVAQFSVFIGVPFSFFIFKVLPMRTGQTYVVIYSVAVFIWGLLISWVAPACNSPIFAEVVPPQLRAIVYSFDRAFEGAIAATGAPIVGWLAEHLGFSTDPDTPSTDHDRAVALGSAIVICTVVPWTLCGLLFTGLHVTYPKDKARANVLGRARSGRLSMGAAQLESALLDEEEVREAVAEISRERSRSLTTRR